MKEIRRSLTDFNFPELFTQHLLWETYKAKYAFEVNGQFFEVEGVAQKRGLVAFVCKPAPNQSFPGSVERKRIGREIEKLHHEHLIIFIDRDHTRQVWAVPKRDEGKSKGTSEIPFFKGKGVEHLARRIQKLSFSLEESETTTIVEVAARVNQALLAERVTKKFFKEFSDQRKAFVKFLDWIEDESKRDWYCSVLLNRLMFIYFLGGKGFLPGGTGFLTASLAANKALNGADSFYTHFLLPLSFFGLGERRGQRGRFEDIFKDVLYLDGGLFAVHQVERELGLNKEAVEKGDFDARTKIPDAEFKKWFDYFDKWRWTLDEDKVENDGYISPHILGYIFEKYINQKQMGAYYTKEDITGYICRNTIIPRLFDMLAETGGKGQQSVRPLPVGPHPNLLNDGRGISDGEGIDRYVYPSVKQEGKLPMETDYEQEQRRKRYEGILNDFDAQKIQGIDDFITYNLHIEKLAVDFVSNIQDPEVLHAFYFKGLQQITVLDPTCGSGAFLFEALITLYPLYNACLSRMRYLVGKTTGNEPDVMNWGGRLHFDDLEIDQSTLADLINGGGTGTKILDDLRAEVGHINDHPSAEYFIKKSIIVNNLFGVDIMEEAVEICKLRLFLTLIATVERDDSKDNLGVEPLPDIDFNILAGNTLVGYTSIDDIDRLWHEVEVTKSTLAFDKDHSRLRTLIGEYGRVLKAWRLQQLGEWKGAPITKEQVVYAVEAVRPELNKDLWNLYKDAGLATVTEKGKGRTLTQNEFNRTHEPLHWLLEFPGIEAAGGFDAVIGNPPYVSYTKPQGPAKTTIKSQYGLLGLHTLPTNDLFAFCMERSILVTKQNGRFGQIVPLSATSTETMKPLAAFLDCQLKQVWNSYYSASDQPASLFSGVRHRLLISLGCVQGGESRLRCATRFLKWFQDERSQLFDAKVQYAILPPSVERQNPKISTEIEVNILTKILAFETVGARLRDSGISIFYHDAPVHWGKIFDFVPSYVVNGRDESPSSHVKTLLVSTREEQSAVIAMLNSSLFYWFLWQYSNCRDLTKRDIGKAPLGYKVMTIQTQQTLQSLTRKLMTDLKANSRPYRRETESAVTVFQSFYPAKSKAILDEIDQVLGHHFGLSADETEFIVNYDLKYRMGLSEEEEGG